jgi:hypothetical protein
MAFPLVALLSLSVQLLPADSTSISLSFAAQSFDRVWAVQALTLFERLSLERSRLEAERKRLRPDLPPSDLGQDEVVQTYGITPTLLVDQEIEFTYPRGYQNPIRTSWLGVYQELMALESSAQLDRWIRFKDGLAEAANRVRYLVFWAARADRLSENPKAQEMARFFNHGAAVVREKFAPRRVWQPRYLPAELPSNQTIILEIGTDIQDRDFLREFEGAVQLHWNFSPWGRGRGVEFKIRWKGQPPARDVLNRERSIEDYVKELKKTERPFVTTGARWTYVDQTVMVLSPGRISVRVLAHEFGHLLGFDDCYYRVVEEAGPFGQRLVEWENPFYPDELMCNLEDGVVHRVQW